MEELKRLLSNLTLRQKISLVVAAIAVVGGLVALSRWNRERDFRPLYTGLAAEDAGAIVARLRENGAPYRLSDNGSTVLVPSAQVAEMRLQMATSGLPRSSGSALSSSTRQTSAPPTSPSRSTITGRSKGAGAFGDGAGRGRAGAGPHLVAEESVFLESRRPAKASVMVKLRPGTRLSAQNVLSVCHLVASAVKSRAGLYPSSICRESAEPAPARRS
jgi:flagellar M-ring protein FliF